MTEKDIAETLTQRRLVDGIETAEEEIFHEYDETFGDWDGDSVSRVNELEQALVSLRVARQIIECITVDDEALQDVATAVLCEDASVESLEEAAELVEDVLQEDGGVSVCQLVRLFNC